MIDNAQIANSSYADTAKALLELVQKLTALGATAILDVPRVVVIGNQSAGKSSVVEAISGITVPRDSGLCTRCPMECRMSYSKSPWTCQVYIRWEYDADDQRRKQVIQVPFGDIIMDKWDVELVLRRAQFAVLNEDVNAKTVLGMSAEQLKAGISGSKARPFSRNVVCVDLEGPELTDLSFIDLPGLIQNEEDHLVKLVESLVVDHIKGNTLILVTIPMTDDLENQKALTLARQADPDGRRTIGVLTKPDVVSKGSRSRDLWLEVIEGRKRPLLHGYFCTRQPDDDERERGITPAEARQAEMSYFEREEPWSKSVQKGRFGIKNLAKMLSPLLAQIIRESLPKISAKTSEYLDKCTADLKKLPEAIKGDPREHLRNLVTLLYDSFNDYAKGSQGSENLVQDSRKAFTRFKTDIRATSPCYVPFLRNETETRASDLKAFNNYLEDEDKDERVKASTTQYIYLDEVRKHIEESITRELPDNVPFPAKIKLIVVFQEKWPGYAKACFAQVRDETIRVLLDRVRVHFGRWDYLHTQMRIYVTNLVKKHFENSLPFVEDVLQIERTPFTQNTHYLQYTREAWLAKYRSTRTGKDVSKSAKQEYVTADPKSMPFNFASAGQRHAQASPPNLNGFFSAHMPNVVLPSDPAKVGRLLAELAELGYPGLIAEDLKRLVKPDEYDTEMKVMAEVRSYFQVAYKRIVDYIPASIDSKFIKGMAADLRAHMLEQLKLAAPDAAERCNRYLSEDPSVSALREELTARKCTLENVKETLDSFGGAMPTFNLASQ